MPKVPKSSPSTATDSPASSTAAEKPASGDSSRDETADADGLGDAWDLEGEENEPPPALRQAQPELNLQSPEGRGWRMASSIVSRYRPVAHLMWPLIHAVYGKQGEIGKPDPLTFSNVSQLLVRAGEDKTLAGDKAKQRPPDSKGVARAYEAMGADVTGAVCLVHAVCRKITSTVNEKVSWPILDDALLRTHIGYHVGKLSRNVGAGRGMVAGFAGRCGLAVQIASGDKDQAGRALAGMASGQDMGVICTAVYGCDPLEVAALTLISGGCSREIAFGISAYASRNHEVPDDRDQFLWYSLFSVVEGYRMGQTDAVPEKCWEALGFTPARRGELFEHVMNSQRRGHGWHWLTEPQVMVHTEGDDKLRSPSEIRKKRATDNESPE